MVFSALLALMLNKGYLSVNFTPVFNRSSTGLFFFKQQLLTERKTKRFLSIYFSSLYMYFAFSYDLRSFNRHYESHVPEWLCEDCHFQSVIQISVVWLSLQEKIVRLPTHCNTKTDIHLLEGTYANSTKNTKIAARIHHI